MSEMLEVFNGLAGPIQSIGIIIALIYTVRQSKALKKQVENLEIQSEALKHQSESLKEQTSNFKSKAVYAVFDKFSDRMLDMRMLQLTDKQVRKIWDGGNEGDVLSQKDIDEKHFYFAKMLFQINDAYYMALQDPSVDTGSKGLRIEPWKNNFRSDLSSRKFREIWKHSIVQNSYSAPFRELVNELIDEIEGIKV